MTDAELEEALAKVIEREAEQMVSDDDHESELNLRRWIEDMRRVLRAGNVSASAERK